MLIVSAKEDKQLKIEKMSDFLTARVDEYDEHKNKISILENRNTNCPEM